jgi:hypothetical protein
MLNGTWGASALIARVPAAVLCCLYSISTIYLHGQECSGLAIVKRLAALFDQPQVLTDARMAWLQVTMLDCF